MVFLFCGREREITLLELRAVLGGGRGEEEKIKKRKEKYF